MSGDIERDNGIERVLRKADPDWKVAYSMIGEAFIMSMERNRVFSGTEINDYIRSVIGDPHTPNAWSGMFNGLIRPYLKGNLVVFEGFAKSPKASHHSHYIRNYRKV